MCQVENKAWSSHLLTKKFLWLAAHITAAVDWGVSYQNPVPIGRGHPPVLLQASRSTHCKDACSILFPFAQGLCRALGLEKPPLFTFRSTSCYVFQHTAPKKRVKYAPKRVQGALSLVSRAEGSKVIASRASVGLILMTYRTNEDSRLT